MFKVDIRHNQRYRQQWFTRVSCVGNYRYDVGNIGTEKWTRDVVKCSGSTKTLSMTYKVKKNPIDSESDVSLMQSDTDSEEITNWTSLISDSFACHRVKPKANAKNILIVMS